MSYGWPVEPFDEHHAVRGFFCDPRIGEGAGVRFTSESMCPRRTERRSTQVEGGKVQLQGEKNVAVATGSRSHGYWHLVPRVGPGQWVARHALLAKTFGHVHLAERRRGRYWNPLRAGALTPFDDFGAPVVDRIVVERAGVPLDPGALTGLVNLIGVAHDVPPMSAPPQWRRMSVTPALVRWRLLRAGRVVLPWGVAADFRSTLLPNSRFSTVYTPGTRPEPPLQAGPLPLLACPPLGHAAASRRALPARGEAADIRGNASRAHLQLVLVNEV